MKHHLLFAVTILVTLALLWSFVEMSFDWIIDPSEPYKFGRCAFVFIWLIICVNYDFLMYLMGIEKPQRRKE